MFNNSSLLLRYIPNVLKNATGEPSFLEKLTPFLTQSEQWLSDNFTSSAAINTIKTSDDANPLLHHCRMAVAAQAMLLAIPQLDLILTPNGFGVVSNQNIAPASKERIERLLATLEKLRDDALTTILPLLPDAEFWSTSPQCDYFCATLFPHLDVVPMLGYTDHIWQRYQHIRTQLLMIEQRLEQDYFSQPLYDTLRRAHLLNAWQSTTSPTQYKTIYRRLAAIELEILTKSDYPLPTIIDTVNTIRTSSEEQFQEWKQSPTARLFQSHPYTNKENSPAYFF